MNLPGNILVVGQTILCLLVNLLDLVQNLEKVVIYSQIEVIVRGDNRQFRRL